MRPPTRDRTMAASRYDDDGRKKPWSGCNQLNRLIDTRSGIPTPQVGVRLTQVSRMERFLGALWPYSGLVPDLRYMFLTMRSPNLPLHLKGARHLQTYEPTKNEWNYLDGTCVSSATCRNPAEVRILQILYKKYVHVSCTC